MNRAIDILLSVYGDAPFLVEFLDSLRSQSCQDFCVIYRCDGNVPEKTRNLLKTFENSQELSGQEHLGVIGSYQKLLSESTAEYRMFADQDDVWFPDKVKKSYEKIRAMEKEFGCDVPILVHSDLQVVDAALNVIDASLFHYQSLNPQRNSLRDLMIQNNVTGCAAICNTALANLAHFPQNTICHDWYLAMIAAAFGQIGIIDEALIAYRQHGNNVYGAVSRKKILSHLSVWKDWHQRLVMTQRQAAAFLQEFRGKLTSEQVKFLEAWSNNLTEKNYVRRLYSALKYGFRKNDRLRTLGMWMSL